MKATQQSLIEQLKITDHEINRRKEYFSISTADCELLQSLKKLINEHLQEIVDEFYAKIITFDKMDRLIGDSETLKRLTNHLQNYILSIFDGNFDEHYVHTRLRIGVVHKRIGVDPKFFVSAVHNLISTLQKKVEEHLPKDDPNLKKSVAVIQKILLFDLSIAFDTYINSLMEEVRRSKEDLEKYTSSLEHIVADRTRKLRRQARQDGLTKILNQHSFYDELRKELLRGQRRNYSTVLIYFDLDGFKKLNDTQGHKRGDEILVIIAESMRKTLRESEISARYGGDEFCIVLPESSIDDAQKVCNRLIREIQKNVKGTGVSCSIGIAIAAPDESSDAGTLVKKADKAMYEAKQQKGFSVFISKD